MMLKQITKKYAGVLGAAVLGALVLCSSPAGKLDAEAAGLLTTELDGNAAASDPAYALTLENAGTGVTIAPAENNKDTASTYGNAGSSSGARSAADQADKASAEKASAARTSTDKAVASKVSGDKAGQDSTSDSRDDINFDYVASDLANWKAVYLPVLEAKGTLGSRGKLPERQSRNLDVTDAIEDIYQNLTDTIKSSGVLKTEKALILYDVLNGNYSRRAVEALLDHGYFTDYYADLHKAGLVESSYHLPTKSYSIDVLDEKVSVPGDDGESTTYRMLKTDSPYLDTEQLLTVARSTRDKKTIRTLEKKAASFEEDFVPKYKN